MTNTFSHLRVITTLALVLPMSACDAGGGFDDSSDTTSADEAGDTGETLPEGEDDRTSDLEGIEAEFAAAAAEFDVPMQILQAVGYVETRWQMVEGEEEFEGQYPAFGVMALRGDHIEAGAELVGASVDDVKYDRATNIRAGAAVLRAYADVQEIDRKDLRAWATPIAAMSDISVEEALSSYIHHDIYGILQNGVEVSDADGKSIVSLRADALVKPEFTAPSAPNLAPGPDYPGSVWRASPNYSGRSGHSVKMVVIHSCEGSYASCWGWLTKKASGVSAHYVIKEDGSEISQLVKEANKAWHIGADYKCSLNSSKECGLNGVGSNSFSVGIEHAGFAKQKSWHPNLLDQSARLTCDITKAHNIPRDKYHIIAHGQLQPYNRIDPGPNWPWASYLQKVNAYCGAPPPPPPAAGSAIVIDNDPNNNDPNKTKVVASTTWKASAATPGFHGNGYRFALTSPVTDGFEFWFYLDKPATKTVDAWWTAGTNRATKAPFVMFDASQKKLGTAFVNQQQNGGKWVTLGTYSFSAGWNKVVLSRWTTEGYVVMADAVRVR